jgi:ABC-type antimicrobial peptide transport system permease subunit
MTIVGVIRDARRADVTKAIRPELYRCALQATPRTQMLVVRTAGEPAAIFPSLRNEVRQLNPQLPLYRVNTLQTQLSSTMNQPRFRAVLLTGFAVIALALATIGIYGVTAHAVNQRRHEVGVRMALGASAREVLSLILKQHLRPALVGVVLGIAGALVLARFLESLVYGVGASDPLTFGFMAITLVAVAVIACWIPARRATRVDPLIALRTE